MAAGSRRSRVPGRAGRPRRGRKGDGCGVKSWEILRDAADRIGVKALAAKLNLSAALVYKWCQETAKDDPAASGARNPLDRVKAIYDATGDPRVVNWICHQAGGFFVKNPSAESRPVELAMIHATQRFVHEFGEMLAAVSRSIENDGVITREEADHIRKTWESLKATAEQFVVGCERGLYGKPAAERR